MDRCRAPYEMEPGDLRGLLPSSGCKAATLRALIQGRATRSCTLVAC